MSERLAAELEQLTAAVLAAQQHLLELLRQKRRALTAADLPAVEALQPAETQAAVRLQALLEWRTKLLAKAQESGLAAPTLTDLAGRMGNPAQTRSLLESSRRTALELQRESWVHWILTNRCAQHGRDVLDRIAHGGKRAPTYQLDESTGGGGGTLLNASA